MVKVYLNSNLTGRITIDPSAPPDPQAEWLLKMIQPSVEIPDLGIQVAPWGKPSRNDGPVILLAVVILVAILIIYKAGW